MPEQPHEVAVVVVNFGAPDLLRANLTALSERSPGLIVVVVDNLSSPQAREQVRLLCEERHWEGVFPATNTGFGVGCNLGAERALQRGAEVLVFVNPDASIDPDSIALLTKAVADDPGLVAAPTVRTPTGAIWSAGSDLDLDIGDMRSWRRRAEHHGAATMPWVSGACLAISRQLWSRIDGFDSDYFLYWEDVDLCARVLAAGGSVGVIEGATAVHDEGQTHGPSQARAKSPTYYYYNIRNRQLFAAKWLSEERQRHWRRSAGKAAYQVLLRGGRRQLLHPRKPLTAVWRGLRDGSKAAKAVSRDPATPLIG